MHDYTFENVEQMQKDIKDKQYDVTQLLDMLEEYKWLIEFKPFQDLVDTHAVSTEALYDACKAYARWYEFTQYNQGMQNILFLDGWRKDNPDECELFLHPMFHQRSSLAKEMGIKLDEDARIKSKENQWARDREKYYRQRMSENH